MELTASICSERSLGSRHIGCSPARDDSSHCTKRKHAQLLQLVTQPSLDMWLRSAGKQQTQQRRDTRREMRGESAHDTHVALTVAPNSAPGAHVLAGVPSKDLHGPAQLGLMQKSITCIACHKQLLAAGPVLDHRPLHA